MNKLSSAELINYHGRLDREGQPHDCQDFERQIREEQRAEEAEADEIAETRDILKAARLI